MNVDQAVIILLVANVAGLIIMLPITREILRREAFNMFDEIVDNLFTKTKMSDLGTKSGEKRKSKAIMEQVANDILDGPQLKGLKMAASAIGVDVDEYIEEHGAVDTIGAVTSLANMLGIDVMSLLSQGLNSSGQTVSGDNNPYLK